MNESTLKDSVLKNLDISDLNEIQIAANDAIKNHNEIILLSPTGSGKTLAFLLPILQQLKKEITAVQCLVIVPSRELALQIEQVWKKMATGFKVNVCYGGHDINIELKNLSNPPALLIGTPGRLTDHLSRESFSTESIHTLVLDEFDKSLQLGFQEEMSTILDQLPALKKKVLTSATSDVDLPDFLNINEPHVVKHTSDSADKLSIKKVISQVKDKIDTLTELICSLNSEPAIIFCNHREVAERISGLLFERGIVNGYYHGGMDQDDRERVLIKFRNGSINYLLTTDLAARGLDIPEMKHVIHYHLPAKESEFTHRNGRTARMHASGTAYIVLYKEDKTPDYLPLNLRTLNLQPNNPLPQPPLYKTLYISGGKKNKLNKSDILGFFIQKGNLDKADVGMIEVKDFISFVAVRSEKVADFLRTISNEKMKGKKYKIEIARDIIKKE